MEFSILGPLDVQHDGHRVDVGGKQAEKALATLLVSNDRVVSIDTMTAALWDGEPPRTSRQQIHKLMSKLRQRLPGAIATDAHGYRLIGAETDAARFAELSRVASIPSLSAALELWRGPALHGIDSRALRETATMLDEQRLAVTERLVTLQLDEGDPTTVIGDLRALIAAHTHRETLHGLLMVALYRSGRRADALDVYANARAELVEELGIEPGPELAHIHEQVLRSDSALDRATPRSRSNLPYDVPDFTGRVTDLDRLLRDIESRPIQVIDGMAGAGKTALAVRAAHRLTEHYPDGQLMIDLLGHTPGASALEPAAALESLLRLLGVPADRIPDDLPGRSALWRTELAGRRLLLVLDNSSTAAQVRPLLPGHRGCATLITSRSHLGDIEGARSLTLDVLSAFEGLELLGDIAGQARVAAEPAAAASVVDLCGRLPLALRLAGGRLASRPSWSVQSLCDRLSDDATRLTLLATRDHGVARAFAASYANLPAAEQQLFRLLGAHPGPDIDAHAAAALAEVTPAEAESGLERLVDDHLLRQQSEGRFTFHDLLRSFARQLGHDDEATARLRDYYLATTVTAADLLDAAVRRFTPELVHAPRRRPDIHDRSAGVRWLTTEYANLLAFSQDWRMAYVLRPYFEQAGRFFDWRTTHEAALQHVDDTDAKTLLNVNLGVLAGLTGRFTGGIDHFRAALTMVTDSGFRAGILTQLGMLLHQAQRDAEAATELESALALNSGNLRVEAMAMCNLGLTAARLGQPQRSLKLHRDALRRAADAGEPALECAAHLGAGESSIRVGVAARDHFDQALRIARNESDRIQEALALDGIAHVTGDPMFWREALDIFADLGAAQAGVVRDHLNHPGLANCDLCREPAQ